jgi:hypothetical protein
MARGRMQDGVELRQRPKVPVLVTEEDLHGLKTLGATVETSPHPINGNYTDNGCEGILSIQSFPRNGFSCKSHN